MTQFSEAADRFHSAEALLDELPLLLTDDVARMPRRARIDRAVAPRRVGVLGDMRRRAQVAQLADEEPVAICLVARHRNPMIAGHMGHHFEAGIAFAVAVRGRDHRIDDQARAVLHQNGPGSGGAPRDPARSCTTARRDRWSRRAPHSGGVGHESDGWIAPRARGWILIPRTETLPGRLGLERRAVDGEVLARQQVRRVGVDQDRVEERGGNVAVQQPTTILREGRADHTGSHAQADKPPKQQVVVQLFDQLAFAANRVERLQQQGAEELHGGIDVRPKLMYSVPKRGESRSTPRRINFSPDVERVLTDACHPYCGMPAIPRLAQRSGTRSTPRRTWIVSPPVILASSTAKTTDCLFLACRCPRGRREKWASRCDQMARLSTKLLLLTHDISELSVYGDPRELPAVRETAVTSCLTYRSKSRRFFSRAAQP